MIRKICGIKNTLGRILIGMGFLFLMTSASVAQETEDIPEDHISSDDTENPPEEEDENDDEDITEEKKEPVFQWQLKPGETLEIKKTSRQLIKLNADKIEREVVHRVILDVEEATEDGYKLDARFYSKFYYREKEKSDMVYKEEETHSSRFVLNKNGILDVPDKFYMPNVRNIPFFPEGQELQPGATWDGDGLEIMEFHEKIKVLFNVQYEYAGKETLKGGELDGTFVHKIIFRYPIQYDAKSDHKDEPQKIMGFNTGVLFWSEELHIPYLVIENYKLAVMMKNGDTTEIQIRSKAIYSRIPAQKIDDIQEELAEKNKGNETLIPHQKDKDGNLRITLPGVQFEHNSAALSPEIEKILDEIHSILEKYENVQLRIAGHTDSTGEADYNLRLSENRAKNVAEYMISHSGIPRENISYEGKGHKKPVADNSTPAGRAKNRRVEIIILKK